MSFLQTALVTWSKNSVLIGIYTAAFLDLLGVGVIIARIPQYLESLQASHTLIGAHASLYGILQLFASPVVGRISDLYGRRPTLLVVLLFTSLGYLLFALTDTIWIFFLFRIPTGLMKHSLTTARLCLTDITKQENRTIRMGRYSAVATTGFAIGLTMGGHIMDRFGFKAVACTTSTIFFLNFILSWWLIHPTRNTHSKTSKRVDFDWLQIISFTRSDVWSKISLLMVQRFFLFISMTMLQRSKYRILRGRFGTSPMDISYIASLQCLMSVIAAMSLKVISQFYSDNAQLRRHACVVITLSIVGSLFANRLWIFIIFLLALDAMAPVQRVIETQLCFICTAPEEKGEVLGVCQSVWALTRILAPQIAGILMDYHYNFPLIIASTFAIIGTSHMFFHATSKSEETKKTN